MKQCVLEKCQSPELCNDMSACDVRLYRESVLSYKSERVFDGTRPLSDEHVEKLRSKGLIDVDGYILWLRGLALKGGKGVVNNIDARCLGRVADELERLNDALVVYHI